MYIYIYIYVYIYIYIHIYIYIYVDIYTELRLLPVTAVAQWVKAPGIHCYVAGSIPAVTPRYCTQKIEKCSLKRKNPKGKNKIYTYIQCTPTENEITSLSRLLLLFIGPEKGPIIWTSLLQVVGGIPLPLMKSYRRLGIESSRFFSYIHISTQLHWSVLYL